MFGLPNPYLIGGVALVIAALTGWALWERHDAIASAKGEAAAREQLTVARQDAARWQAASDVRDARLAQLSTALDEQSAVIQQGRAKEQVLSAALAETARRNITLQQTADQLSRELDDEASKAPGDVIPLGPIVLRRAPSLFND
jgi:hypothetical protein